MSTNELKSYTDEVEQLLEAADDAAAHDKLRDALYKATSAVSVLVGLVSALAKSS